jgi:hypothetical protein
VRRLVEEPLYHYRMRAESLTSDRLRTLRTRSPCWKALPPPRTPPEGRSVLRRSAARQRATLALTEAEAALSERSPDARKRALAVAFVARIRLVSRAAALAAALAPKIAARLLERRARAGRTRLTRSAPRLVRTRGAASSPAFFLPPFPKTIGPPGAASCWFTASGRRSGRTRRRRDPRQATKWPP